MTSIISSVILFITTLVKTLGYPGIFIAMTIESASIPLPSEIIMGAAGFLVYTGEMNLWIAGLVGAFGNLFGSSIMYFLGARGGRPVVKKYGKYIHYDEHKFNTTQKWFEKYGDKIVFISQLLPVIRTFVSLPAGVLKIEYKKFAIYTFTGALIWCTALAYIASLLGAEWEKISEYMKPFEGALAVVFLLVVAFYVINKLYKRRAKTISPEIVAEVEEKLED